MIGYYLIKARIVCQIYSRDCLNLNLMRTIWDIEQERCNGGNQDKGASPPHRAFAYSGNHAPKICSAVHGQTSGFDAAMLVSFDARLSASSHALSSQSQSNKRLAYLGGFISHSAPSRKRYG